MKIKIVLPNNDGSAAITMQEVDQAPQVGDILIYANGNAVYLAGVNATPDDPSGCAYTCGVAPRGRTLQGRNIS